MLRGKENSIKQVLNELVKQIRQFEIYLKINWRGKLPNQIFDEIIQLEFKIFDSDFEIFKKLQNFKDPDFVLTKAVNFLLINTYRLVEQFESQIPQSFGILKRIINQPNDVQSGRSYIILLGGTKVGKSTLLNILNNPTNVVLINNKFQVIQKDERILISDTVNSETYQISHINIDQDFVFVDTPSISDTNQDCRVINHYSIYREITSRLNNNQKLLFLLLIDVEELQINQNEFFESITFLKQIFNNQINVNSLRNSIIPVFVRIQNDNTIQYIKLIWDRDIMEGIKDQFVINVCKYIKDLLEDKNRYLILENGKNYQNDNQTQLLKTEIYNLQKEQIEFQNAGNYYFCDYVGQQIIQKQNELEEKQKFTFKKKMIQIKDDFLQKFRSVLEKQQQINREELRQKSQLNMFLQDQVGSVLKICKNFYQQCLFNITNEFTIKILFDDKERCKYLIKFQLEDFSKMKALSDLPKDIINEQLQKQIEVINDFVDFLNPENNQNQNSKEVQFNYFHQEFQIQKDSFNYDLHIYDEKIELLTQGWKNVNEEEFLPKKLLRQIFFSFVHLIQTPNLITSKIHQTFQEKYIIKEEVLTENLRNYYELKREKKYEKD